MIWGGSVDGKVNPKVSLMEVNKWLLAIPVPRIKPVHDFCTVAFIRSTARIRSVKALDAGGFV